MTKYSYLLVSGLLLGTGLATTAYAAPPTTLVGTLTGDYARTSTDGGDGDKWGFNGEAAFGLGLSGIAAQIQGGYNRISFDDVDADTDAWNVGGSLYLAPDMGRFGATVTYTSLNFGGAASGLDADVTTYGVFGEFYVSPMFTIAAKGGGATGTVDLAGAGGGSDTGTYLGGNLTGYVMPNLALSGTIDYVDISDVQITEYGIGLEYLVSETTPVSILAGYSRTQLSDNGGDADTWRIGVKFYTGGPAPLVVRHRTGTLGWAGTVSGIRSAF